MILRDSLTRWAYLPKFTKTGDVGIEIEVEYKGKPPKLSSDYWTVTDEGSLRGNAVEYISKTPFPIADLGKRLDFICKKINTVESRVDKDSPRTSVHVHTNQLDKDVLKVYNQMFLYWLMEDVIVDTFCASNRVGNLFCLRLKDAEGILKSIDKDLKYSSSYHFSNLDPTKYGGQNIGSIINLGTIEYRSMGGVYEADKLHDWVSMLHSINETSKEYANPIAMFDAFEAQDNGAFLKNAVGFVMGQKIIDTCPDYAARMNEAALMMNAIVYDNDWDYIKDKEKPDDVKPKGKSIPQEGWRAQLFEEVRRGAGANRIILDDPIGENGFIVEDDEPEEDGGW